MRWLFTILVPLLLVFCGCTTTATPQKALSATELEAFLARAKDPRREGLTLYQSPFGPEYHGANRVHPERHSNVRLISSKKDPLPVFFAESRSRDPFPVLLDTSARESWGRYEAAAMLSYTLFEPPAGEYPDHVESEIPGYVGAASRLRGGDFNWAQLILYMPPAAGGMGPLLRQENRVPADREKISVDAVLGFSALKELNYLRLNYAQREFRVSSSSTPYRTPKGFTAMLTLPLGDWRGRPAIHGTLDDGIRYTFVIDTAGGFDLSIPGDPDHMPRPAQLRLDETDFPLTRVYFHRELGLPEDFPPRIGYGLLGRQITTLDIKQKRLLLESPHTTREQTGPSDEAPVSTYRGIRPKN